MCVAMLDIGGHKSHQEQQDQQELARGQLDVEQVVVENQPDSEHEAQVVVGQHHYR